MSVAYLTLRETATRQTIQKFFKLSRQCSDAFADETAAVVLLQRMWRGYNARKYVGILHFNSTEIKRVWRGYKGRQAARLQRQRQLTNAEKAYYDIMATQIQKCYRGRLSRKQKQDFYRRKKYVDHVTRQSHALASDIDQNIGNLKQMLQEQEEEAKSREFVKATGDLHHLVGTKQIPGVFSSPYGEEFATTAYGLNLEAQIRDNVSAKIQASDALKATRPPKRQNKTQTMSSASTVRLSRKKRNSRKKKKEKAAKAAAATAKREGADQTMLAAEMATLVQVTN